MRRAAVVALVDRRGARELRPDSGLVAVTLGASGVLLRVDAVPGSMSTASARERVGQPFLRDHELAAHLAEHSGPVHLVVVQGGKLSGERSAPPRPPHL